MKRNWAVLAALGVSVVTGCTKASDTINRRDSAAVIASRKVRVAFSPHESWGPIMIAQEEGFFREEGLDVELVAIDRSEESLVALVSGDIDVRPGPISSGFLSAIAQGAQMKITAGMGYLPPGGCTYFGVVRRKGIDTNNVKQVKRVRLSADGYTRFLASRMFEQHNININDFESVRLLEALIVQTIATGGLDAAATSEPLLTKAAHVGTRWMAAQDAVPNYQWAIIAFGKRLLTKDRDTGVRFLRAYRRGVERFGAGKTDRNVDIIARGTGDTPESTREACWPSFQHDSRINWASIDEFQSWAIEQKLATKQLNIDQVWDSTFVAASDAAAR